MKLYMLSKDPIDTCARGNDVEGVAVEFLLTENSSTFYFALLICAKIGEDKKNERLRDLLRNVATEVDINGLSKLADFLRESLNREQPEKETWTCFAFKDSSPLNSFTSHEVKVFNSTIPALPETTILAIAVSNNDDNGIYRPCELRVFSTLFNKRRDNHKWYGDAYYLPSGELTFEKSAQDDLKGVSLNLPYTWQRASNGLSGRLSLAIALKREGTTASRITFNNRDAMPTDGYLPLGTAADDQERRFKRFEYHEGNQFRFSLEDTEPHTIHWDTANALELTFVGSNLEWRISESEMELWATSAEEFKFTPALSFVSKLVDKLVDKFDVVHPAVNRSGVSVKPLIVSVHARVPNAGQGLLNMGLNWPEGGESPTWVVDNDAQFIITPIKANIGDEVAEPARFISLGSNLSGLLGTPLDKQVSGDFVGLGASLAKQQQTLSQFVMELKCSITKQKTADLELLVVFNLRKMKLEDDEMSFRFLWNPDLPQERGMDFGLFLIEKPEWPSGTELSQSYRDGTINVNVADGALVVAPIRNGEPIDKPVRMLVPGGPGFGQEDKDYESKRWLLHLKDETNVEPNTEGNVLLRIARTGVTLNAELQPKTIALLKKEEKLFRSIEADPVAKGRIEIKDNQILEGELQARMMVPGTSDLRATAFARFAQDPKGTARFSAELRIDNESSRPVCELLIGFFDAQISRPRLGLAWKTEDNGQNGKWDIQAIVDAELAIRSNIELQNGMTELRSFSSIVVKDLDLLALSYEKLESSKSLELRTRNFAFSVFGLVGLQLDRVKIGWDGNKKIVTLKSEMATITFGDIGQTRGGISIGNLELACGDRRVKIKSISGAGVSLSVPGKFDFHGGVSWKDEQDEQYFSINGRLTTFGGLAIEGLLKYGSVTKRNGDRVPYLAAFASRGNINRVVTTIPPIVFQEGGIGAGFNAELGNLSRNPSVEEILEKIDSLEPTVESNWRPVRDNGTYVTVVGKVVFTSQIAMENTVCGYVLSLVASIDSNGRIIAAGKVWLFSSQRFAKEHNRSPSLVAAMHVDLRRPSITFRAETRKGAAIEAFPQLKEILDRTQALLTVRLTPELFDIFLERLNYRQQWLGGEFDFSASWRFSIFRETVLQYVRASARGRWGASLGGESGGFTFNVALDAGLAFGGLVGRLGVMTWGRFSANITATCSAFVEVEFSVPYVEWKGVKSSIEYRTVSKRFNMPTQSVSLGVSGDYAFRGRSGGISAGARLQVHFDRHFCGQRLSISPVYSFDAGVVKDVKDRVRVFEAQLDRVANQRSKELRVEKAKQRINEETQRRNMLERIKSTEVEPTEEWIVIEVVDDSQDLEHRWRWAIVPSYSTPWLAANRQEADTNPLFAWHFKDHVQKIKVVDTIIIPVWDHDNWNDQPTENTLQVSDHPFLQLNSLFAESAVEVNSPAVISEAADQVAWLQIRSDEGPIEDLRPLRRLRDALVDEDRLSLPSQVYPFTFRPQSGGKYEDVAADAADSRLGRERLQLGTADYRSARGAILAMLIEEMTGRVKNGVFSQDKYRQTTRYIQDGLFPENKQVSVTRGVQSENQQSENQQSGKVVKTIRLALESSHVVKESNYVVDVRELSQRIKTFQGCQEFRIPTEAAESAPIKTPNDTLEVVIKLPISFRELFDPIEIASEKSSDPLKTKWFELVDHVRIKRRMPFEKEFQQLGGAIPLPAEVMDNQVLLHPFIFTDILKIPAESRGDRDRFLEAIEYQLVVVPIGWANRDEDDFKQLTRPFPSIEPFVPGTFQLKGDLGIVFVFEEGLLVSDGKLNAKMIHTTSSSENSEVVLNTDLKEDNFEIWTESRVLTQDGSYGRTVAANAQVVLSNETSNRESRISREASGQELRSTIGLTQQSVRLVNGMLTFRDLQFESSRAYRFFIRVKGCSPITPVRELPVFLARNGTREEIIRPMSVRDLEKVQLADPEKPQHVVVSPVEASDADPRHRLLVQWDHPSDVNVGSVELEVYDAQENRRLFGHRIEVLTESLFREHVRNFSEHSEWHRIGGEGQSQSVCSNTPNDFRDWYWDENRWFYGPLQNAKTNNNDLSGLSELNSLHDCLKSFLDEKKPPSTEELFKSVRELWDVIARFFRDHQNDGSIATAAIQELRCALIAQFSGLFPGTNKMFADLEQEYAEKRDTILGLSLKSITGSSPEDTFHKRLDLLAARQLVRLVEYRRLYALNAIDEVSSARPKKTDADLRVEDVGLPEKDQEKQIFGGWLNNTAASDIEKLFPHTHWFFERMIPKKEPKESGHDKDDVSWCQFHPGKETAKRILEEVLQITNAPTRYSEEKYIQIKDVKDATIGDKKKWHTVPFVVELQKILDRTIELENDPKRLVTRSHHTLGTALDEELQKIPVSTPLESLLPEPIRKGDDPASAASSLFPAFLNLLERLGFAVDVALEHPDLGIQSQEELKWHLDASIGISEKDAEDAEDAEDWHFAVVYGRAMDDGSAASAETKFPFAKLMVIPKVSFSNDSWRSLLDDRSITYPDGESGNALRTSAWNWWNESIKLISREQHMEHRGGAVITIPVVGNGKCRIQLPVPTLQGQKLQARIRSLSRYHFIQEWLANGDTTELTRSGIVESEPVELRPYYSATPPSPAVPFGVASYNRIDFIIAHPADEVDSRDNLLTATRTGFRHLGLTFIHQPVDLDKLSQLDIGDTADQPLPITCKDVSLQERVISCFSNESIVGISHLPYYMEVALLARSIYDSVGKSASDISPKLNLLDPEHSEEVVFMRRRTSLKGAGQIKFVKKFKEHYIQFSLVRHYDLLIKDELGTLPNDWEINGKSLRYLPDIRTSYLLLYEVTDARLNDETRLVSLFQLLLPACPGYDAISTSKQEMLRKTDSKLGAKVQKISSKISVDVGPHPFLIKRNVPTPTNTNGDEFLVEVLVDLKTLDPNKLYVATFREGQIAISPVTVKDGE